jgi:hypothetical protein
MDPEFAISRNVFLNSEFWSTEYGFEEAVTGINKKKQTMNLS